MENYQVLSLIGCILGILISMGWFGILGFIGITGAGGFDQYIQSLVGYFFAFVLYIIALVMTFTMTKRLKILGVSLIAIGVVTSVLTILWGIVAFGLLLPAGIVSLRYTEVKRDKS